MKRTLPYGRTPLRVTLPAETTVVTAKTPLPAPNLSGLLGNALANPLESPGLGELARSGGKIMIVVSDATRAEPRAEMIVNVLREIPPDASVIVAIANGTHGPGPLESLGLECLGAGISVENHDAFDDGCLIHVGTTSRGTPITLNRKAVDADVIVLLGKIKPHYFAGFSAGSKALFPGLGGNRAIRKNHRLKCELGAVAGQVDGNPCRDDLEEVLGMVKADVFLLNVVGDSEDHIQGAVAGNPLAAFRVGAAQCRDLFITHAPMAEIVVVSDRLPITSSLYQASKMVAAAASRLKPGGTVVLAAQCPDGIGPVETVNRGIYEIGLKPRLPENHRCVLVSDLDADAVASTYCDWAPSVESAIGDCTDVLVLPHASSMLFEDA